MRKVVLSRNLMTRKHKIQSRDTLLNANVRDTDLHSSTQQFQPYAQGLCSKCMQVLLRGAGMCCFAFCIVLASEF